LRADFHNLITAFMDLSFAEAAERCHAVATITGFATSLAANRACRSIEREGTVIDQDVVRLKNCSEMEFAYWGVKDFAYIRRVLIDGQPAIAVHAANGTQLAVLETVAAAQVAVLRNDMEPLSVH
jgi:hypothetical protein